MDACANKFKDEGIALVYDGFAAIERIYQECMIAMGKATALRLTAANSANIILSSFDKELQFFINNQEALVKLYPDKVLVLRGQEVVGVYDTPLEAYLRAQEKYKLGTFMLQPCLPGPQAYTATISTPQVLSNPV